MIYSNLQVWFSYPPKLEQPVAIKLCLGIPTVDAVAPWAAPGLLRPFHRRPRQQAPREDARRGLAGRLRSKSIIITLRFSSLHSMLRARTSAWVTPMPVESAQCRRCVDQLQAVRECSQAVRCTRAVARTQRQQPSQRITMISGPDRLNQNVRSRTAVSFQLLWLGDSWRDMCVSPRSAAKKKIPPPSHQKLAAGQTPNFTVLQQQNRQTKGHRLRPRYRYRLRILQATCHCRTFVSLQPWP